MMGLITAAAMTLVLGGQTAPSYGPEVTIYNQGFGFVKEIRNLQLKMGRQEISITDVPAQIDTTSVAFKSLSGPDSFDLLEQNYQYDLVNAEAILNKAVGQRIRLVRHFGNLAETLEGTLMSSPTAVTNAAGGMGMEYNGMVVRLDDGHIILNPEGEVEVLSIPEGMISVPTLMWDVDAHRSGPDRVELSYITQGMRWEANYVMTLDSNAGTAGLQGWVTLDNRSGATYKNARLKLLAGNVNVDRRTAGIVFKAANAAPMGGRGGGGFAQEQLFEYHLYTLGRPATIRDKESKQLSLLSGDGVPFKKRLIIDALRDYGTYYPSEGEIGGGTQHAQVRVEFVNDEKSNLGMPLPAGKFRIYQRDKSGSVQMLGEDSIEHTPKNEKVSLKVGEAFDVVSNRKRLSFQVLGANRYRETFQIEVRNRKETEETVEVLERHFGDWSVDKSSDPFTKEDANTMRYVLDLKPNEVHTITYTVTTHW
jgi:hypothetical protein